MSQRSPVIFGLLLAATLSADAVAVHLVRNRNTLDDLILYGRIAFFAFLFSELSLMSIWATFASRAWSMRWGLTAGATLGAAWLTTAVRELSFSDTFGLLGSYVLTTSVLLWGLTNTSTWHRMAGHEVSPRWQFGVKHILVIMTVLGAIIVAWRNGYEFRDNWDETAVLVIGSAVLAVSAAFIRQLRTHCSKRLAALLALAGAIGTIASWADWFTLPSWIEVATFFLIQAVVLALWLELTPIIPRRAAGAVAEQAATAPAVQARSPAE